MKITFEEVLSRKEWLHEELMNSLTGDVINKAMDDQFYDVKLVVNGIEIEPKLFNNIVTNIEKYVDDKAQLLIKEKYLGVQNKIEKISMMFDGITEQLNGEYNLDDF